MKNFLKKVALTSVLTVGLLFSGVSANAAQEKYVVKEGDTLSKISHDFVGDNSLIHTIAGLNGIQNIDLIFVGQELLIDTENKTVEVAYVEEVQAEYVEPTQDTYVAQVEVQSAPTQSYTGNSSSAKEWIAQRESGGDYGAVNGQYYGKYQLNPSLYVGYDHSPAGQEAAADAYVADRYGSWENAQAFWMSNGWY